MTAITTGVGPELPQPNSGLGNNSCRIQRADNVLFTTLSRAQKITDDLDRLITAGNKSCGARYKLLLKENLKIVRLRENIKDAQDALGLALNVDILSAMASPSGCTIPRLTR